MILTGHLPNRFDLNLNCTELVKLFLLFRNTSELLLLGKPSFVETIIYIDTIYSNCYCILVSFLVNKIEVNYKVINKSKPTLERAAKFAQLRL